MSDINTFAEPYARMSDTSTDPERLEKLKFHLESGDYFPLISTVMCFLEEGMRECESGNALTLAPIESAMLKNVREDLIYLHKNYKITPKA